MCGDSLLPDAGGVLDQDYGLMYRMRSLQNIYRTVSRLRNLKGKDIHSLTDSERRLLRGLRDLGLLYR